MKAIRWLRKYWYVPLFVVGLVLGAVMAVLLRRPPKNVVRETRLELEAIDAGTEAKKLTAELGAAKAKDEVRKRYAKKYLELDIAEKEKARQLEAYPAALASFLVRAGSSRPTE